MIDQGDIQWKYISSWQFTNQHHTMLRDDSLGLQMESITNRTQEGYGLGKKRDFFFIDKDVREFLTVEELVEAYNEKFKLDDEDPEHEVRYVKIVVKRDTNKIIKIDNGE